MTPDTAAVERVADALSHAQMLLLAVEAGDREPELAMRVKDLILALSPPEGEAPADPNLRYPVRPKDLKAAIAYIDERVKGQRRIFLDVEPVVLIVHELKRAMLAASPVPGDG